MTEEQLHALLDSYEQRVSNDEDKKLFAEAVRAAKASAIRAAYFTLWICCVESIKRRLNGLPEHDPSIDELPAKLSSMQAIQEPTVLIEAAQQFDLILGSGAVKLQRIYAMQKSCSCAGEVAPPLDNFVADSFAVVSSVLCRSGMMEWGSALEQALVLSRDVTSLVSNLRQQLIEIEPVQLS